MDNTLHRTLELLNHRIPAMTGEHLAFLVTAIEARIKHPLLTNLPVLPLPRPEQEFFRKYIGTDILASGDVINRRLTINTSLTPGEDVHLGIGQYMQLILEEISQHSLHVYGNDLSFYEYEPPTDVTGKAKLIEQKQQLENKI